MEGDFIDLYCERVGPGLWAEPLNLVTNLAFILAGVLLVVALRRAEPAVRRDPAIIGLAVLVLVVGIGSGLFHSFATRWAALAAVIPIALFILFYLRSEEHTSEIQSLMRISYAAFCLKKKKQTQLR